MDPILKLQTFNPFEKFLTKIPILLFVKFELYNWVMTTGKRGNLSLYFINRRAKDYDFSVKINLFLETVGLCCQS